MRGSGNITFLTAPRTSPDLYAIERTGKIWVLLNTRMRRAGNLQGQVFKLSPF